MRSPKHQPKSDYQVRRYLDAIKKSDYEPTIDDSLNFSETDDKSKDLSVSEAINKRRRPPFKYRLADHFTENWIYWVIGFVGTILFLFLFDFNRDLGKLEGNVEIMQGSISDIKEKNNQIGEQLQKIEIDNAKQDVRIDNLERNYNQSQTRSEVIKK